MKNAIKVLVFTFVVIAVAAGSVLFYLNYGKNEFEVVAGSKNGTVEIVKYHGNDKNVVIPSKIKGDKVVSIGQTAFSKTDIESVEIPNTVATIGERAFFSCEKLSNVNFGKGITEIQDGAFYKCSALKKITIPAEVKTIGGGVFLDCNFDEFSVEENGNFIIQDGVLYNKSKTTVYWIDGKKDLSNFDFPKSVTALTDYLMSNRNELKTVSLPEKLKEIPNGLFVNCANLESVVIPENVISIGEASFFGCMKMKNVKIPQSVKQIGIGNFPDKEEEEMKDFALVVTENSYAHVYAQENKINFELTEG